MIDHLGFTGTKMGMTSEQRVKVVWLLKEFAPNNVHHGDCVGGDEEFHELAGLTRKIVRHVHPPIEPKYRANVMIRDKDVLYSQKSYHKRNHDIVEASSVLIAAPGQTTEILRSGTWSAVRYAKGLSDRPRIVIVRPDGSHYEA